MQCIGITFIVTERRFYFTDIANIILRIVLLIKKNQIRFYKQQTSKNAFDIGLIY